MGIVAIDGDRRLALTLAATDKDAFIASGEDQLALIGFGDQSPPEAFPRVGHGISTAGISGNGRWAISADYKHDLFVWNLAEDFLPIPLKQARLWRDAEFAGFSVDGRCAVLNNNGQRYTFDLETEQWLTAGDSGPLESATHAESILELPEDLDSHPDASHFVVKTADTDAIIGERERERTHVAAIVASATSPNGQWDATVSVDGTVRIWDTTANRTLAVFGGDSPFSRCQWSPDNRTLAVDGGWSGTHLLRLEAVASGGESD